MMMALGLFVFMLTTLPYQEFKHQMAWRHPSNSRVGQRPQSQFLGADDEIITLTGVLYPELTGGRLSLLGLQQMANTGKAWSLVEGNGTLYGLFVIESLSCNKSIFFSDGSARKIEFTLTLKRSDETRQDVLGDLAEQIEALPEKIASSARSLLS